MQNKFIFIEMKSPKIIIFFTFFTLFFYKVYAQMPTLGNEYFGKASYYGKKFYGRKTASGEILQADEMTCAHPTLPFGTMLEVTNLKTNKWVVVRVNDRGPYAKGRIIDLTHIAAEELKMFGHGVIKVKLIIVGEKGQVYISRPQTMVEDSAELIEAESLAVVVPMSVNDKDKSQKKAKQKKQVFKKRANRRKKK